MIAGIENIEKEISSVLKKYEILDNIEIRYSNLNNVDLQCNNLVRYSNNTNLSSIKKDLISLIKEAISCFRSLDIGALELDKFQYEHIGHLILSARYSSLSSSSLSKSSYRASACIKKQKNNKDLKIFLKFFIPNIYINYTNPMSDNLSINN